MKVAIIGASRNRTGIGEYIAKYFHKNGVRVVAILGTTKTTAQKASSTLKKYGIEASSYTCFREMVRDTEPDMMVIASPSSTHYEYLIECIDLDLSIFCEKPFFWTKTGDIKKILEDILTKATKKKLTLAMNSQLPFSIEYYEGICGKINTQKTNKFSISMSPSLSGKEMITESVPHVLSILYFIFGAGEILSLDFESMENRRITIRFKYVYQTNECVVLIKLETQEKQPRDLSFGFDDRIVTRVIDLRTYDIYLTYGNRKFKIADPLELSVKDFITAFERKTKPLIDSNHILSNMSLLKRIYDGYENVVEITNGKAQE